MVRPEVRGRVPSIQRDDGIGGSVVCFGPEVISLTYTRSRYALSHLRTLLNLEQVIRLVKPGEFTRVSKYIADDHSCSNRRILEHAFSLRALDAELSPLQHVDVDRLPSGASLGPLVFEDSRLAHLRPALKIGDRARIGRVYFEKIARTHCIDRLRRLN